MAALVLFDVFPYDLAKKIHNFDADTIKLALTNTAPNTATNAVIADITQISAGSGYTTGGEATTSLGLNNGPPTTWSCSGAEFAASGGSIGPFRYVVFYNSTASGGPLIGYTDYGMALSIPDGSTFNVAVVGATLTIENV